MPPGTAARAAKLGAEPDADDISKEGDAYLRNLLVQGAQHILGPFGPDCDLRRWGLKLAERGGKSGKKWAITATARNPTVLLHRLWVTGNVYNRCTTAGARPYPQWPKK